jgi:hypothetical protein
MSLKTPANSRVHSTGNAMKYWDVNSENSTEIYILILFILIVRQA